MQALGTINGVFKVIEIPFRSALGVINLYTWIRHPKETRTTEKVNVVVTGFHVTTSIANVGAQISGNKQARKITNGINGFTELLQAGSDLSVSISRHGLHWHNLLDLVQFVTIAASHFGLHKELSNSIELERKTPYLSDKDKALLEKKIQTGKNISSIASTLEGSISFIKMAPQTGRSSKLIVNNLINASRKFPEKWPQIQHSGYLFLLYGAHKLHLSNKLFSQEEAKKQPSDSSSSFPPPFASFSEEQKAQEKEKKFNLFEQQSEVAFKAFFDLLSRSEKTYQMLEKELQNIIPDIIADNDMEHLFDSYLCKITGKSIRYPVRFRMPNGSKYDTHAPLYEKSEVLKFLREKPGEIIPGQKEIKTEEDLVFPAETGSIEEIELGDIQFMINNSIKTFLSRIGKLFEENNQE